MGYHKIGLTSNPKRRNTMKKFVTIVSILILACIFVFANGSTESTQAQDSGNKTIAMTWWGDTKRNEVYCNVIAEFMKANPNITVETPYSTWANYFDKLSTQIAGGAAPDVIGMHQRYVSEYASRGALADLQPYVDKGIIDLSDIPESVVNAGRVNGVLYMLPQGISGSGVSYYTSVFDELGVEYPDANWTWDQYVETLDELKKAADEKGKKNFWPSTDFSYDFYNFSYWARTNGQTLFTEDGQLGFTKETLISWLEFWKDLRNKGYITDAATTVEYTDIALEQSLMATHKVAVSVMPISQVVKYEILVSEGEYHLVRFPRLAGGKDPEYLSGAFYTLNSKSKNPDEAAALINFFINDPTGQAIYKQEQGMPPANSAVEMIKANANRAETESIKFVQELLIPNATPEPYPPAGYNEINSNFKNIATAVSFGEKTPEAAANEFFEICKGILN